MSMTVPVSVRRADTGSRVPALDGVRGIAVAAVLLFHTGASPLPGGYLGVDLFFVLSGFLITGILLAEARRDGRIALGAFWLRRARRLAPPLLLLLLVLGGVRLLVPQTTGDAWRADLLAALTYTTNWWEIVQAGDYFAQFGAVSPVQHTWSLAIEEQFYLLFAVFMAWVARRAIGRRRLLLVLLLGTCGSVATMLWVSASGDVAWAYYGTVPRLQALLIGAMLAVLLRGGSGPAALARWRDPVGAVGLLGLAVLMMGLWPPSFGPLYTVVALCAAALIWSATGDGRLAALLAWRPLVLLGVISYGVYLWHWPIFLWLQGDDAPVALQAFSVGLTLLVAVVSFRAVERPIRSGRFTLLPVRVQWGWYAMVGAAVLFLAMAPARTAAPTAPVLSEQPIAALPDQREGEPSRADAPARSAREWPADTQVPRRILTNGDSVVLAMTLQFPHDKYPGRQVRGAALLGCGFSELAYYPMEGVLPPPPECETWRDEWRSWEAQIDPEVAVTGVSGWDTFDRSFDGVQISPGNLFFDRAFSLALESGLRIAGRDGEIPVYVLGMPCFAAEKDGQFRNDPVRRQHLNGLAQQVVGRVPRAEYVDLTDFTCDDGPGISNERARALYRDGVHWSPQGGRAMWALLLQRFRDDGVMARG